MPNVYLIGMPGCGKTTLAQGAALELNRPFLDLDEVIEQTWGITIPQIFATQGEAGFRQKESAALQKAAQKDGYLVATGGGIILRPENCSLMRQTGRVIFIDRPLALLLQDVTADYRPLLAGDKKSRLQQLYQQRLPLYRQAATDTIKNEATLQQCLQDLIQLLHQPLLL